MRGYKDWWKHYFGRIYLVTDARSVCSRRLTKKETDIIEKILHLNKENAILDMCGGEGRHSLELARRGYRDITVVDYSAYLISLGIKRAKEQNLPVRFIKSDVRRTRLPGKSYSAVFIMANSFGYFMDERQNMHILKEAIRLLKRGGRFLLDIAKADYIKRRLAPSGWHEAEGGIVVCRKREIKDDVIMARELVISKKTGLLKDGRYCERIYTKRNIRRLLLDAGFRHISIKDNICLHGDGQDYGFLSSRMFISAVKP